MKLKTCFLGLLIATCVVMTISPAWAKTPSADRHLQTARQQLTIIHKRIDLAHKKLAALRRENQHPLTTDQPTTRKRLATTQLQLAIMKSTLNNDEIEMATIRQGIADTQNSIITVKSNLDHAASQIHSTHPRFQQHLTQLQNQLASKRDLLKLQKRQLIHATEYHNTNQTMKNELKITLARLSERVQTQRLQRQTHALQKLEDRLQKSRTS